MSTEQAAAALKALRERAGYGMREFARAVGESSSTYATYERGAFKRDFIPIEKARAWAPHLVGRGQPPVTAAEVAALAGTTVEYLKIAAAPLRQDLPGEFVDDPDELAWLRLWRVMEDAERHVLLRRLGAGIEQDDVRHRNTRSA